MKKLFLAACLSLIATGAFAQTSFNVKAAFNMANHMGVDGGNMKPGFKAGVGMEYAFNDLISLQPSLMFATKGAKGNIFELPNARIDATVNQMYLELPIMVGFRFNIGGNTNIVLSVGPYVAYGIGGKTKITSSIAIPGWEADGDVYTQDTFGDSDMRRFDAGVGVGAAVEFDRFFVGLDSEFGLINLHEDSDAKNISVGIGVGFKF